MPIVTYTKFSKKENREIHYLRWQGYIGGKKVQKHFGRTGVSENEQRALQKDIQYLKELIERTKDELYSQEQKLVGLSRKMNNEFSISKDRNEIEDSISNDRTITQESILEDRKNTEATMSLLLDEHILSLWKPPVNDSETKIKVFRLYEQGTTYQEAAKILELPQKTVMNWYKKFKTLL